MVGEGGKSREESIKIIENDIPRTFSKEAPGFFSKDGVYYEKCLSVLEAFAIYRPDIGYVQGMSYICGLLML